ncbi:D-inositol-3-phosphate glycosyltransferase [Lacunisphaera limnophila]|uniref:D-inositol-3-phosphate glycosyltransferase n=1 Tax=Lacunisphaera limnophila TaxID=1838286 RepID=A0A1D8AVK1_9BACT|nr:glycosyltransferase [Lacunisphaera limnophila]AOS44928.1 D-inositol-3-phosphate glycosyltransferase [Lacunisphaera limnophila]
MNRAPLLFDASHTSHTSAQTGIQRVCRTFFVELAATRPVAPVCYDPHLIGWRPLGPGEQAVLTDRSGGTGKSRGAKWTLAQKISGATRRWIGARPALPAAAGLICPELFSAKVGAHLPELLAAVPGPRVAIFYDAIPLKFPELTPPGTVARFPAYLRELLLFDGVAAISEDSATALRDYWRWLGVTQLPPVHALPLAIDRAHTDPTSVPTPAGARPTLLCVCTIEGRKNHLALLEACATLWDEGLDFELHLVGMARPDTAAAALTRITELQAAGRPLRFNGSVPEAALHDAYRGCAFTVYPSLIEGFGMPVLESLQHGKPCVCSGRGALGESAHGGGCVPLDTVDAPALTSAIRRLLQQPAELARLAAAARARHLRTWPEYAADFTAWMATLPRRP